MKHFEVLDRLELNASPLSRGARIETAIPVGIFDGVHVAPLTGGAD